MGFFRSMFYFGALLLGALLPATIVLYIPSSPESNVDFAPPPEGLLSSHRRTKKVTSTGNKKQNSSPITVITTGEQDKWNNIVDSANINFQSITEKWNLPQTAIPILKEIHKNRAGSDYNSTSDILALNHPLKTGGTSFSLMLKEIFGKTRIFPGSGASAHFMHPNFKKALEQYPPNESPEYWYNKAVIYTHTILRPQPPFKQKKSSKASFFENLRGKVGSPLKEKKIRLMSMIRNPLDLAASRFFETNCRVMAHTPGMSEAKTLSECPKVNLTDVARIRTEIAKKNCRNKKMNKNCNDIKYRHCESIDNFLESKRTHNQYASTIMGQLPQLPENDNSQTPTYDDVALYSLRDLGGLIQYNNNNGDEDFILFIITERMKESLCIFYYTLKLDPVPERTSRFKPCRPIHLWEERHKKYVEEHEKFDYTIWRAANAILDVRLEAMKLEIKSRLDQGEELNSIRYLGPGCYVE